MRLKLLAPAKLNLCLRVTARREDGYHNIDSIFVPLELADTVEIELQPTPLASSSSISCSCPGLPQLSGPDNLAARAAAAFLDHISTRARVRLTLHKRIWPAAGLGGGSSDAAAVLNGLQQLLGGPDPAELTSLARKLGADVPFFLQAKLARSRGIGDQLQPLPPLPPFHLVLLNPQVQLSTRAVYRGLGLARGQNHSTGLVLEAWPPASASALAAFLENDLLPPATQLVPSISSMRQALKAAGSLGTGLTGSGPTVFGVFAQAAAARAAADQLMEINKYWVQQTCPRAGTCFAPSA